MTKTVINFIVKTANKRTHLIVCSLFFFLSFPLFAANEHINGFKLISCSSDNEICTRLIVSKTVERSFISPLYSFAVASVEVQNKKTNTKNVFNSEEGGYYDPIASEIILRNVLEVGGGEILIKLSDGKISKYLK